MDSKEPASVVAAKPPTICDKLQRAFHTRPAFRPLRRLTGRPQDGGALAGSVPTHGGPPPPVSLPPPAPVASPVGKAPAATSPSTLPTPLTPAAAKPGQVPASAPTVTATTGKVGEKAAGGMPVPVPPSAVTGRPPVESKGGDKAQKTQGKTRVGSRVRKALASSK